ncbi:MAG: hypothetical protein MZW92_23580 [Comamonadaceae bacterium]|nr:hypothetical protein [Comamonadaceae bacterium]
MNVNTAPREVLVGGHRRARPGHRRAPGAAAPARPVRDARAELEAQAAEAPPLDAGARRASASQLLRGRAAACGWTNACSRSARCCERRGRRAGAPRVQRVELSVTPALSGHAPTRYDDDRALPPPTDPLRQGPPAPAHCPCPFSPSSSRARERLRRAQAGGDAGARLRGCRTECAFVLSTDGRSGGAGRAARRRRCCPRADTRGASCWPRPTSAGTAITLPKAPAGPAARGAGRRARGGAARRRTRRCTSRLAPGAARRRSRLGGGDRTGPGWRAAAGGAGSGRRRASSASVPRARGPTDAAARPLRRRRAATTAAARCGSTLAARRRRGLPAAATAALARALLPRLAGEPARWTATPAAAAAGRALAGRAGAGAEPTPSARCRRRAALATCASSTSRRGIAARVALRDGAAALRQPAVAAGALGPGGAAGACSCSG